jgi:type II secretory pathway component PulF
MWQMNYDEFAFFNQQLAAMLREGIPLEGALKQLCIGMRGGALRAEIQQLEADLAGGTPLKDALARRALPELYRRMLEIGARGNDLPGVLTLIADHYHRANALWTRLKGLMVYPVIVLVFSLVLTFSVSVMLQYFANSFYDQFPRTQAMGVTMALVWVPPVVFAVLASLSVAAISIPRCRGWLRWRVPPFKEASLAQLASALALMLKQGTTLADALALVEGLETATPAGRSTVAQWRALVESGQGKPAQWPLPARPFPPLFLWLVQKSGEDLAAGFSKAADIYQARANYKTELVLYGALPVSILFLGLMIILQFMPLVSSVFSVINMLTDFN